MSAAIPALLDLSDPDGQDNVVVRLMRARTAFEEHGALANEIRCSRALYDAFGRLMERTAKQNNVLWPDFDPSVPLYLRPYVFFGIPLVCDPGIEGFDPVPVA